MSKNKNQNKLNYISKINIVNKNLIKSNHLVTKKNTNLKIININKIFNKGNSNQKRIDDYKTHRKLNSNIEDYNNLVKLNISVKLKKLHLNKIIKKPSHRRLLTERNVCDFNNSKKKKGIHLVLIKSRNNKNKNGDYRFITEYFSKENIKSNKVSTQPITNNNWDNNNNSLNIDFHQILTETNNSKLITKNKNCKKISNFTEKTQTPRKKRYIKYLKANNLYNLSHDDTCFNSNLRKKVITRNKIESFDITEKNNFISNNNSNINTSNYGYSFDAKKQTMFGNYYINKPRKNAKNKILKKILRTYSNGSIGKRLIDKKTNLNIKNFFQKKLNNLTIETILNKTKKNHLSKIKHSKLVLKKRNMINTNSNSKDKHYLTIQNSSKEIKSPIYNKKVNIKNKYETKILNLWSSTFHLSNNSKPKMTNIIKQKNNIATGSGTLKKQEQIIKKIKNIFSLTKKGFWFPGIEKENQDNYFIYNKLNNQLNNYFIGVCDGHGKFGREVSSYISKNLPFNLNKNILNSKLNINIASISSLSKIISQTFIQTNQSLSKNTDIDTSISGSTCSSIIISQKRLISINLGDSRCVLGKYNSEFNIWSYINLTRDHKPNLEEEKDRIIKKGGKICKGKDEFGNSFGVLRIWQKEEGGIGLALTRSFGDEILSKYGIICEPEIKEYYLSIDDKFIIIATDGLWEYISSKECIDIVKKFFLKSDIKEAGNYLYKEASKRWITQQDVVDDITIILIFFD